jgi:hypothetical protein
MVVVMKSWIFWDITPCSPLKANILEDDDVSIFRFEEKPSKTPA